MIGYKGVQYLLKILPKFIDMLEHFMMLAFLNTYQHSKYKRFTVGDLLENK